MARRGFTGMPGDSRVPGDRYIATFSAFARLQAGMTPAEPDGQLQDIVVRDPTISAAIDEPMRAMVLDVLSDEALTASQVYDRLEQRGVDRTENTIRHHINELRDAGLVDVVRFEEGRGGTTKYYKATTIVLSYSLPESETATVEALTDAARPHMEAALETLTDEFQSEIDSLAAEMGPCEHCETQKYEPYILLTVLRRAFVQSYFQTD